MIPTINDSAEDFHRISNLYEHIVPGTAPGVTWSFDFSHCGFLRPAGVAALGAIIKDVERVGGTVAIQRTSISENVRRALQKNGFLAQHGIGSDERFADNAVRYRRDAVLDAESLATYLDDEWLGRGWILRQKPEVRLEILNSAVELFNNAFEHGQPPSGVFSCGQRFPNLSDVQLCVIDLGNGIPSTVRNFLRRPNMRDVECLEWAMVRGNTSKPVHGRGLGLYLLSELVAGDGSHLEIYSGKAVLRVHHRKLVPRPLDFRFPGTAVQITINPASVGHMMESREVPPVVF